VFIRVIRGRPGGLLQLLPVHYSRPLSQTDRMVKVERQGAAQGAESAVYDCLDCD